MTTVTECEMESDKLADSMPLYRALTLTFIAVLASMSLYVAVKDLLFPHLNRWQSHLTGIVFSSTVATIASYFVVRVYHTLYLQYERQIEERTHAEEALRRAHSELEARVAERTGELEHVNAFLRNVIDTAPCLIFVKDRDGRFVLVNKALAGMYGATTGEITGRCDADFNSNAEEVEQFLKDDREVMDLKQDKLIPEERISDANEQIHWLQTIKRPLVDPEGRCNQLLGIATDITSMREAEAEIRSLNEHLSENLEEMCKAYDATIEGWSRFLDLRDKETEGHSRRVTKMTLELAKVMGMSGDELVHVRRGALLHDIGKMGVPDDILLKPGPLTEEQWIVMRLHPVYAHDMLTPIEFLKPAIDIPYCHHERWDGEGYPRGLSGTDIPLSARIFAVIDVCDALLSNRPYRQGWPYDKVMAHIKSLSGSHFDPEVVATFFEVFGQQDLEIRKAA